MSGADDYEQAEAYDIQASQLEAVIEKQAEQLRDYEAALEFYAMRQEYAQRIEKPAHRGGCPIITYPIGLRSDGRIARETLAKWKGTK